LISGEINEDSLFEKGKDFYKKIGVEFVNGFEELSRFFLYEGTYRKFILKDNRLVGTLIIGKGVNRKLLKPLIKKVILRMVNVSKAKTDFLKEDFDFNFLLKELYYG
jgi:NAD(P)H-nitrite reductase large subunit